MDRRSFLSGAAALALAPAASATCPGKLAPAPISAIDLEGIIARDWPYKVIEVNIPYKASWVEDRFHIEKIPLEQIYVD